MCLTYFELDEAAVHAVVATPLLAVLALKIIVVRRWHSASRFLPALGIIVLRALRAHLADLAPATSFSRTRWTTGSHTRQMIGSLLAAVAIAAVVVVAVTAKLGPTSVAELDAREAAREQRIEPQQERREAAEERREERLEDPLDAGGLRRRSDSRRFLGRLRGLVELAAGDRPSCGPRRGRRRP